MCYKYCVIVANRGYYPHIKKFDKHIDAVKYSLDCFSNGYDFIRIDVYVRQ